MDKILLKESETKRLQISVINKIIIYEINPSHKIYFVEKQKEKNKTKKKLSNGCDKLGTAYFVCFLYTFIYL